MIGIFSDKYLSLQHSYPFLNLNCHICLSIQSSKTNIQPHHRHNHHSCSFVFAIVTCSDFFAIMTDPAIAIMTVLNHEESFDIVTSPLMNLYVYLREFITRQGRGQARVPGWSCGGHCDQEGPDCSGRDGGRAKRDLHILHQDFHQEDAGVSSELRIKAKKLFPSEPYFALRSLERICGPYNFCMIFIKSLLTIFKKVRYLSGNSFSVRRPSSARSCAAC